MGFYDRSSRSEYNFTCRFLRVLGSVSSLQCHAQCPEQDLSGVDTSANGGKSYRQPSAHAVLQTWLSWRLKVTRQPRAEVSHGAISDRSLSLFCVVRVLAQHKTQKEIGTYGLLRSELAQ